MLVILALAAVLSANPVPVDDRGTITAKDVEAPGPQGVLKGSLVSPGNGAPVVLIIPGSGPTDRDGNNPLGVKAAPYRLLADGLASAGIASVRTDKRGLFGSVGAVADPNDVTIDDYVRDTGAWVDVIRHQTRASCVWLLGHSEGGLVALAAAKRIDGLCGTILVATSGRPTGDLLKEQLRANAANAPLLAAAEQAIDTLASGQRVDVATLPPALVPIFAPAVQGFLISNFALDPSVLAADVARSGIPMMILQGGRDLQVTDTDAALLKQAAPDALLVTLPDANHVLKSVAADDVQANIASYAAGDLPLASGVVDAIAQFVKRPRPVLVPTD